MDTERTTQRRANKADVAALAGVSHQTVSRVVNGSAAVAEATRRRVEDAISALHYRPNRAARSLATSRFDAVGVLSLRRPGRGMMDEILRGIGERASAQGQAVSFADVDVEPSEDGADARIRQAVDRFVSEGVDGLIVVSAYIGTGRALGQLVDELPIVRLLGERIAGAGSAGTDDRAGGALAGAHLRGLGHAAAAVIAGPANRTDAVARLRGFTESFGGAGQGRLERGAWTADAGYDAADRLLRSGADFTALFCANDHLALGAIHRLHDAGLRVPHDVSVIGYDDSAESAHLLPPLTTIRQDVVELGRRAHAALERQLVGEEPVHDVLAPTLVPRASTARRVR